jgi:hypothetical protein
MDTSSGTEDQMPILYGYAELMGFGHSRERTLELESEVRAFMADIARLWEIDVEGYEMAVRFEPAPREAW